MLSQSSGFASQGREAPGEGTEMKSTPACDMNSENLLGQTAVDVNPSTPSSLRLVTQPLSLGGQNESRRGWVVAVHEHYIQES